MPIDTDMAAFTFDERNRLRGVLNETTGETSTYTYYGDGLRATKTENGAQTNTAMSSQSQAQMARN
ncbi:hypothetical protein [Brevibacillus gelatini]|uniref:hypothetical protein n=1 Tax=Brevibacillus gelatini TaxID=1655277 RepID=UPI00319EB63B